LQPALSERFAGQSYTNQVLGRPVWFRWDLRQWQCFSPDEPKAGTTTLGSPKRTLGAFCGGGLSGWGRSRAWSIAYLQVINRVLTGIKQAIYPSKRPVISLLSPCYIAKRLRWTDRSQLVVDGSFSGAHVNVSPPHGDAVEVLTRTSPIGEVLGSAAFASVTEQAPVLSDEQCTGNHGHPRPALQSIAPSVGLVFVATRVARSGR
jgi:hypothetical protein